VQEGGGHFFEFTTTSIIPGTDKSPNIEQAIHIKFPPSLKIDENFKDPEVIKISGNGVSVTGITY
jgi:hypothetical protein